MCRRKKKKKTNKEKEKRTKKLYASYIRQESVEKYMISRFLKVDVVLEDLITLGKELKRVTMNEFKWSEGLYIGICF